MEIVDANVAALSNYEVSVALQQMKDAKENKKLKKDGSLATVIYETLRYLQQSDCSKQNDQQIDSILRELKKYKLTKTEKLMIVNTPPRSPVEIQLIVQESEERLTEKEVEEILAIVSNTFPLDEND